MNGASPATERVLDRFISDDFFASIQIARTSRRQGHSGMCPRLEYAKRSDPERHEEPDPPPAIDTRDHEREGECHTGGECSRAHHEPPPPLPRSDVLDAASLFGHTTGSTAFLIEPTCGAFRVLVRVGGASPRRISLPLISGASVNAR